MESIQIIKAWEVKSVRLDPTKALKVLITPEVSGAGGLSMSFFFGAPGEQVPLHTHARLEVSYVTAGRGVILDRQGQVLGEICADTVVVFPPGVEHSVTNTGDETLKVMDLFVPGYTAEELLAGKAIQWCT